MAERLVDVERQGLSLLHTFPVTIKDPATGAVIRKMTTKLGELEVVDVDDISAVCKPVSGSAFKVGDVARTVTQ